MDKHGIIYVLYRGPWSSLPTRNKFKQLTWIVQKRLRQLKESAQELVSSLAEEWNETGVIM